MMTQPVEYVVSTRIGEKGQLTIPQQYRDGLGLDSGSPVAVRSRSGIGMRISPIRRLAGC